MDLELSDDQQELRDNIRQVLSGACSPLFVRSIYEDEADTDKLWAQMTELYWPALGIAEADGGLGMSFVEVALLAEELGRASAPGPLMATATQFTPIVRELGASSVLAQVAEGSITGALALAENARWDLASITTTAEKRGDGYLLSGTKTAVLDGATADELAVVARSPEGPGVFLVSGADVVATPREVLDRAMPSADVAFDQVMVDADRVLGVPGVDGVAEAVDRAVQEATIAMALMSIGASRRIHELTLEYLKVREQYDRVIGSFQALKHRMADMYLAVERANAIAYYAALTVAEDDPRRAEAAHLAKAAAGDCESLLAEDGLQLHGGIGYTWENDLHFLLKRAKTAGAMCGSAAFHRACLAGMLGLVGEAVPA